MVACAEDNATTTDVSACVLVLGGGSEDDEDFWGAWGTGAGAMGGGFGLLIIGACAAIRKKNVKKRPSDGKKSVRLAVIESALL